MLNTGLRGGGIYCSDLDPVIFNNVIYQNTASWGGGIHCELNSPEILGNDIRENVGTDDCGGIYLFQSAALIDGNRILANFCDGYGAGIEVYNYSTPTIVNNIIAGNECSIGGGIMIRQHSAPVITNNTIVSNTATISGGGIYYNGDDMDLTNSIVWGNSAPTGPQIRHEIYNTTVSFCDIEGGYPYGNQNIDEDPLFEDEATGDYHLTRLSPCIDRGKNNALNLPSTDIDGQGRVTTGLRRAPVGETSHQAVVDIGADEYWGPRMGEMPESPSKMKK